MKRQIRDIVACERVRDEYSESHPLDQKQNALKPEDLIIQGWSSRPQSQWIPMLESGVKITHVPSGISATCDAERSPHANRSIAMHKLESRLEKWKSDRDLSSYVREYAPEVLAEQIAAEKREREINKLVTVITSHYRHPEGMGVQQAAAVLLLSRALYDEGCRIVEQEQDQ